MSSIVVVQRTHPGLYARKRPRQPFLRWFMLYEILHSNTSRTKSHFIHLGTSRQRNRDTKTKTSGHAGTEEGADAGAADGKKEGKTIIKHQRP